MNLKKDVLNSKYELLMTIYPVGSIYTSMNNINPTQIFGFGEWEPIVDRFLYCANSSRETGGSKKISVNNLPSHNHYFSGTTSMAGAHTHLISNRGYYGCGNGGKETISRYDITSDNREYNTGLIIDHAGSHIHSVYGNTADTGSGTDYMPPYITVYTWYRVY